MISPRDQMTLLIPKNNRRKRQRLPKPIATGLGEDLLADFTARVDVGHAEICGDPSREETL